MVIAQTLHKLFQIYTNDILSFESSLCAQYSKFLKYFYANKVTSFLTQG